MTATYLVYGVAVRTDHRFANRLTPTTSEPDVHFVEAHGAVFDPEEAEELYRSPYPLPSGRPHQLVYRVGDDIVVRWSEVTDFRIGRDRIACTLWDETYRYVLEIHLLGTALALWLERTGFPALHASAVVIDPRGSFGPAVAFVGVGGAGKTSTATTLLGGGASLLADDIVAVRHDETTATWWAQPGHPQMRMWPDDADVFVGGHEDLEIVNPFFDKRRVPVGGDAGLGSFAADAAPLRAVYALERRPDWPIGRVDVEAMTSGEAVMTLVRESFLADVIDRLGLAPDRLQRFSMLAGDVPIRRLAYAAGAEAMGVVADAVKRDLAQLPSPP